MSEGYKEQHIVSVFYLKYFSHKKNEKDYVWVYNKNDYSVNECLVKDTCKSKNLYTIPPNSDSLKNKKYIETDILGKIETETSPCLNELITNIKNGIITPQVNKSIISKYMAYQILRTQEAADYFSGDINMKGKDKMYFDYRIIFENKELINNLTSDIENMKWNFFYDRYNRFFTSNFPVIMTPEKWVYNANFIGVQEGKGQGYSFPLSPDILLVAKKNDSSLADLEVALPSKEDIVFYNLIRCFYANKHIISFLENFANFGKIIKHLIELKKNNKVVIWKN